jgi:hypothetical protein
VVVGGGQVIGPPSIASNFTLGTRNSLPKRITGNPLAPPVARYSRPSAYAAVRPIRRIAAASSIVRKSGTAETALIHADSRSRRRPVSNFFISPSNSGGTRQFVTEVSERPTPWSVPEPSCCQPSGQQTAQNDDAHRNAGPGAVGQERAHQRTGTRAAHMATHFLEMCQPQLPQQLPRPRPERQARPDFSPPAVRRPRQLPHQLLAASAERRVPRRVPRRVSRRLRSRRKAPAGAVRGSPRLKPLPNRLGAGRARWMAMSATETLAA